MQSKIPSKWLLLIGIVGAFFSLIFFLFDLPAQSSYIKSTLPTNNQILKNLVDNKSGKSIQSVVLEDTTKPGIPIRLKIPTINVDTTLESVGLTSLGAVGTPKDPAKAAWFNLWPRPGSNGSAIITGHINWYYGAAGVFANLRRVKPGDKIQVQDDKGSIIFFVVREIRSYDAAANAVDVFVSNDGKPHLNLITCEGVWNKRIKQYSKRLVVFADKE